MQDRQPLLDVFVGRAAELAGVAEVIARVKAGQPWLVAIEGDPGVGKTALARRCLAEAADLTVLPVRAGQAEADLDYGLADQVFRVVGGARPVAALAGEAGSATSSFAVGARLLEAVGEQMAAGPAGSTGAVAIFIDDLQWADRKSVEALTFMLRRLSVDPVLAIVTYEGPRTGWTGRPGGCCRAWRTGCRCPWRDSNWTRSRRWRPRSGPGRCRTRWSDGSTRTPAGIRCTCARC